MAGDERCDRNDRWIWPVMDADLLSPVESTPDGRALFRGLLVAAPLSGLLWWGLIALWRAFA